MSAEQRIGRVGWSPDFKSSPAPVKKRSEDVHVFAAPPVFPKNGEVHVDIAHRPVVMTDEIIVSLRPHQEIVHSEGLLLAGPDTSPSPDVEFTYTNWKGETKRRRARFVSFWWGKNQWHPEPQMLVRGYDLDKKADRTYAVKDISDLKTL